MALESVIRSNLQAVSNGELDLWEFADWIDSYAWNMHRDSSRDAIRLASMVLHRFADYDIHGDESGLRSELEKLLDNIVVSEPVEVSEEQVQYYHYLRMANWARAHQGPYPVAA